jgi:lysophospholipase L1-like esterase
MRAVKRLAKALVAVFVLAVFVAYDCPRDTSAMGLVQKRNGSKRQRPVVYLALGDSTGTGVGAKHGGYVARLFARIEQTHPNSRLVNLCASAASTADILREQLKQASVTRPTIVTIGVGANDLIQGIREESFARNFERIIVSLRQKTNAPILLMNVPDISLSPAVPAYMRESARRHIIAYNERIAEIAKRHGLHIVDLYKRSREFSEHPEFFSQDGIHPSDEGYEFWAKLLWPAVAEAVLRNLN